MRGWLNVMADQQLQDSYEAYEFNLISLISLEWPSIFSPKQQLSYRIPRGITGTILS